jgi:hypothetical protein
MTSDSKVMNKKFIHLIKIHIWFNGQLFTWEGLDHSNFEISNFHGYTHVFDTLDGPSSESHEYQVWSTHQDLHLIHRTFFHLTKRYESAVLNPQVSHIVSWSMCGIQDFVTIVYQHFLKCKNVLCIECVSWWSLTSLHSKVLHLCLFSVLFDQGWPCLALDF